jgi:SAM-dependent methyltransferase
MDDKRDIPLPQRLIALLDHLGIQQAHVAAQIPGDIADLVAQHGDRVAGVVLCVPTRLDPVAFTKAAARTLLISAEQGMTGPVTARAAERLPGAKRHIIAGYDAAGWSDTVADRTADVTGAMRDFLVRHRADPATRQAVTSGTHAGLTYSIEGAGPALVLLPFFLAPSQWAPAIPELKNHFTVITLGGAYVGGVAALEDRARAPTYQAMFRTLISQMNVKPGISFLDVGCGSGALDRLLAHHLRGLGATITAVDVNPFLLHEAASLAEAEGVGGGIKFCAGSAESLPFPVASFDATFSVTVLEECDAKKAIAEMARVTKPGGYVGIIVRSIDLPQWWSLEVPQNLRPIAETPPQSVAASGVADASLYSRMRQAGLKDLVCFPTLVTLDRPGSPIWRYREDHVLSHLTGADLTAWQAARAKTAAEGGLIMAHPLHCAVGRKPLA